MAGMDCFLCSLCEWHKKLFAMPWSALAIVAVGFGAVAAAVTLQMFHLAAPCVLCIYQRIPYLVAGVLALLALLLRKNDGATRFLLGLCALAFFVNAGIAFYHSGVERHWWASSAGCEVNQEILRDPQAARLALLRTEASECDRIDFTILGFSLANWNVPICLALALFSLLAATGPCARWGKPKV